MKKSLLLPALLLLAACATPKVAVNPRADFAGIKRVAVLSFNGPKGDLAADLMTQSLLEQGADVVERQHLDSVMREQSSHLRLFRRHATAGQAAQRRFRGHGGGERRELLHRQPVENRHHRNRVAAPLFGGDHHGHAEFAAAQHHGQRLAPVAHGGRGTDSIMWSASMN